MRRVLLVATGDLIAYSIRAGDSGVASGAELLATVPGGTRAADVVVEDTLVEPSWDMSPSTSLGLARRARVALLDDGFDGVVITHGLDTIVDTAFLADLVAGPAAARGVIVFTGAVRRLDELSSDGPRNLAASLTAAADPALRGAGAVVCADDELHAARWADRPDATRVAVFSSTPHPRLARIVGDRVELLSAPPPRPPEAEGEPESDVALIKTHPGMTPMLLTAAVDAGARGIVLEGTGVGNVPVELFTTISELTEWDIPVVVASRSRTHTGRLDQLQSAAGLAAGVGAIGARGLPPVQARAALMVALGAGGVDAVRDWFGRL